MRLFSRHATLTSRPRLEMRCVKTGHFENRPFNILGRGRKRYFQPPVPSSLIKIFRQGPVLGSRRFLFELPKLPSIQIELTPSRGNKPKLLEERVMGLEFVSQGNLSLMQEHGRQKLTPDVFTGQQTC